MGCHTVTGYVRISKVEGSEFQASGLLGSRFRCKNWCVGFGVSGFGV